MLRSLPQVVMRIDDGEVGFEDGLRRLSSQPGLIRWGDLAKSGWLLGRAHVDTPLFPAKCRICHGFMPAIACATCKTRRVSTYPSNDTHRPVHTESAGRSHAHTRRQTDQP